ncbi:MAG: hypothetical protein ACKODJ_04515 [Bacteroidota bacterium]
MTLKRNIFFEREHRINLKLNLLWSQIRLKKFRGNLRRLGSFDKVLGWFDARQIPLAQGLGYRLVQNSKTVAQATVINRGEVCISRDLELDLEHRIASLFSVILLMQNLD